MNEPQESHAAVAASTGLAQAETAGGLELGSTERVDELAAALAAAQAEFPPIPKSRVAQVRTREGPGYSYRYADLADIIKAVTPALAEHGLAVSQPISDDGGRLTLRTRLLHRSGQELASQLSIPAAEGLSPQALGSWLTYMRRYSLAALLGIAAEEDDDAQGASREVPQAAVKGSRRTKPPTSRPDGHKHAASAKGDADEHLKPPPVGGRTITDKQRKRLFAIADDTADRLQVTRDTIQGYVRRWLADLDLESTKDLTKAPYEALCTRLEKLSLTDLAKPSTPDDAGGGPFD